MDVGERKNNNPGIPERRQEKGRKASYGQDAS